MRTGKSRGKVLHCGCRLPPPCGCRLPPPCGCRLPPPCGGALGLTSFFREVFLFDTKKEPKKCPLLPIAREARLKGAWVRALHERFASAPLRIQERTDWPLPGANTLRLNSLQFLFFVADFRSFVGGGVKSHGWIWNPPPRQSKFGPGGVNVEGDGKALRKMQHSCIF